MPSRVPSQRTWDRGATAAFYFAGQISVHNKQQVQLPAHKDVTKVDCEYKFSVYQYDPIAKKYFPCLVPTDGAPRKGFIENDGCSPSLAVADDASSEVQSPENDAPLLGIRPQPIARQVTVATSVSARRVMPRGVAVTN